MLGGPSFFFWRPVFSATLSLKPNLPGFSCQFESRSLRQRKAVFARFPRVVSRIIFHVKPWLLVCCRRPLPRTRSKTMPLRQQCAAPSIPRPMTSGYVGSSTPTVCLFFWEEWARYHFELDSSRLSMNS